MNKKEIVIIFGNQLFKNHRAITDYPNADFLMIEADNIFSKRNYHKHKIMLIMAAMRKYANFLKSKNLKVIYIDLKRGTNYRDELVGLIKKNGYKKIVWQETPDKAPRRIIKSITKELKLDSEIIDCQHFLTPKDQLEKFFNNKSDYRMESFYIQQRRSLNILMDGNRPVGGKWSFDFMNRKPLPKEIKIPQINKFKRDELLEEVSAIVNKYFFNNPGNTEDFWLPTGFAQADEWLSKFINERMNSFGPYEDAMRDGQPFLFHSVISPMLNIGLIDVSYLLEKILENSKSAPLNSLEGIIRQIIGWREFMHGAYEYRDVDIKSNYFSFNKKLEKWWYSNSTPELPLPLKEVLNSTFKYGYNHHIERLMVLGNWFLLSQYDPESVFEWFSSMYVDAYDWVMVPNVYGMSQYADGGIISTKPYISGGNYLQKMGGWWPNLKQAQESEFTDRYWEFIKSNREKLKNIPRMSIILSNNRAKY